MAQVALPTERSRGSILMPANVANHDLKLPLESLDGQDQSAKPAIEIVSSRGADTRWGREQRVAEVDGVLDDPQSCPRVGGLGARVL
jgi:hypothetical protein